MSASFTTWQARFEKLRSNKLFETVVIAIIVVSALTIGARTYDEVSQFEQWLIYLDIAVTIFFLVELLIRMAAERNLTNFFKKGWNVFDFLIVTASLIPMDDSEMVLLARLLRIFRVLRLVSMIPELRLLLVADGALLTSLVFGVFYLWFVAPASAQPAGLGQPATALAGEAWLLLAGAAGAPRASRARATSAPRATRAGRQQPPWGDPREPVSANRVRRLRPGRDGRPPRPRPPGSSR